MKSLRDYFSEHIEITNNNRDRINTKELFNSFCREKSIEDINQRKFNSMVNELGISQKKSNEKRYFIELKYREETPVIEIEKLKEFIRFSDCCIHLPTCKIINEITNVEYLLDFKTKLRDAYDNLLIPEFQSEKEYCDFYEKIINNDIDELTEIRNEIKIISLILFIGEVQAKYKLNREYKLYNFYEE